MNKLTGRYALPKEAKIGMPRQQVNDRSQRSKRQVQSFFISTIVARLFVIAATCGLTTYGAKEMYEVLNTNQITSIQWLFLVLFCINFCWISFAFSQATLGLLYKAIASLWKRREQDPEGITAILVPVYNEDPLCIRARIEAMRDDLVKNAPGKFAFFILSDTNRAHACIKEKQIFHPVLNDKKAKCPVYYRRRFNNAERKAGNIADWVTRFGAQYDCMIILDADSLMSSQCLLSLTRRMAAEPTLGLIQTLPKLIRGDTLYSRLQQFANQCFGPIYAAGLTAWHGNASNFWGHNAIIRIRAFAESCGLPLLPGKAPFGGHVMSHDFIEAALLRRAGWGVRFDTDLQGSYEEAPPSLIDVMVRDRRWCQGNLQHKAFLTAKGLHFASRIHILTGIFAYLSAVFWFALIIVGFALAVQAHFVRPEYFSNPSLFPNWPVFDFERARALFMLSMALVLAPKIYGWLSALLNIRQCLKFGGPIMLTLDTLVEIIISALYAPVLMFAQFLVVVDILKGRDSGWKPQSRDDGASTWKETARAHGHHTLFGLLLAAGAFYLSPQLFFWSLPITFGLLFSIPLSWLSGGLGRGNYVAKMGVLKGPDERNSPLIVKEFEQKLHSLIQQAQPFNEANEEQMLKSYLYDSELYDWHLAQLTEQEESDFNRNEICAAWQIENNSDLDSLLKNLNEQERLAILRKRSLFLSMKKFFYMEQQPSLQASAS
ncbi:glucans biosynthesis glucosyltransferase MdoH [Marinomonas piezotolerans]|uniref:Glucans biosynthesis glucosyltransferase H n=1 Tax=Marinomonas piezotolerans TaxID=2213058 RepID=A0A370U5Q5_9GAMM|nr:glucans biosynthesis glucosyltransferase MdoH [Marinomonas piezotolerans]RDL43117.1 glucans biosynthesis glucosyltransferase MdoH [Marinomonas piezotolerans]